MATMGMAQSVLEHSHHFYDLGAWYVVAECRDAWSVLEEPDLCEQETKVAFELEATVISHFAKLVAHQASAH